MLSYDYTCKSFNTKGANVFEKNYKKLLKAFHVFLFFKQLYFAVCDERTGVKMYILAKGNIQHCFLGGKNMYKYASIHLNYVLIKKYIIKLSGIAKIF